MTNDSIASDSTRESMDEVSILRQAHQDLLNTLHELKEQHGREVQSFRVKLQRERTTNKRLQIKLNVAENSSRQLREELQMIMRGAHKLCRKFRLRLKKSPRVVRESMSSIDGGSTRRRERTQSQWLPLTVSMAQR